MYPLLRQGDRLPTVAAVQILLNRKLQQGEYIKVDGVFGPRTRAAVVNFQGKHHVRPDGTVGKLTWEQLIAGEGLRVVDAVDITNPDDMGVEDADIRSAGGDPLVNFGMCNGVKVVVGQIQARGSGGSVVLLRFHGHGAPGDMGITVGKRSHGSSQFSVKWLDSLAKFLSRLAPIFASFGSVELHGCRVGAGETGRRLLTALARAWGVPVSAGLQSQYGGGLRTFRFEGPTFTAYPRGGSREGWTRSLPVAEIHGMSVGSATSAVPGARIPSMAGR